MLVPTDSGCLKPDLDTRWDMRLGMRWGMIGPADSDLSDRMVY